MEREPPSTGHLRLRSETSQRIGPRAAPQGKKPCELRLELEEASILVVVHGEDLVERVLVRVDVDHPAKNDRLEAAADGIASILRCNRTFETELGPVGALELLALGGHTEVRVQMPHGDAQRNTGVELFFGGALGHGVHGTDEFIAVGSLLIEQGGRARSIEREGFEEAVEVIREVIFGLREIR